MSEGAPMRVALAQFDVALGDVDRNLRRVHDAAREADARGANLLVFPELFLCGYRLEQVADCSLSPHDPRIAEALRVGGRSMAAVLTMQERATAGTETHMYNSAVYYRDGKVAHVQRKLSLVDYPPFNEDRHFQPGTELSTFSLGGHRAAILICNDAWTDPWTPELSEDALEAGQELLSTPVRSAVSDYAKYAAEAGAELLIVPINSAISEYSKFIDTQRAWGELTEATAIGLNCPVVMVNRVGEEEGLRFFGGSRIVDPQIGVVVEADFDYRETLLVHDLRLARQAPRPDLSGPAKAGHELAL